MRFRGLRIDVQYPVVFQTGEDIAEGTTVNLSVPGCAIDSTADVSLGQDVRLHVLLPDESLRVEVGVVRWVSSHRFGIEFRRLPLDQQHRIRRAIQAYALADRV